ncbi:MAG: HD domain-containing protein [Chlamydiales bacterium]|nr:HD domain-containing protein [Chlamydiales bacterium]
MRCFSLILAIMSASVPAFAESEPMASQVMVVQTIDLHIDNCRQVIRTTTQDHPKVLAQFSTFSTTLKQAYVSGEGLIHKDVHKILDSLSFAAQKHHFQKRKDPENLPYIIHPIGVADHLMAIGGVRDTDVIVAALLHDTVEDTDTTFDEIEKLFGSRVSGFVREVTDDKTLAKQQRKALQFQHAPEKTAGAAQIKLADKLNNLTDMAKGPPVDWEPERVDEYFRWAPNVVNRLPWVNAPLKQAVDDVVAGYWLSKRSN